MKILLKRQEFLQVSFEGKIKVGESSDLTASSLGVFGHVECGGFTKYVE